MTGLNRNSIQTANFLSIDQVAEQLIGAKPKAKSPETGVTFKDVLTEKVFESEGGLKFSKHAANRLADRGLSISDSQLERLNDGAKRASEKGIKESLVMVDDLAFIVNVPNHTVVTAMDSSSTNDNVFTNINGAVIA